MTIIVYGIPHTGNSLVCQFLDFIGKGYIQDHLTMLPHDGDTIIMPIRDPALHFLSLRKRNNRSDFNGLLDDCNRWWKQLTAAADKYEPIIIPTDKGWKIGSDALVELASTLGGIRDCSTYGWPVVNAGWKEPTTMCEFRSVSKVEQEIIFESLSGHRERWGYGH